MSTPTRRQFIQSTLLASAPLILPRGLWAQGGAPNSRIVLGMIGMGRMMQGHLQTFLGNDDVQVVAVCDVDTTRREHAKAQVDAAYAAKSGSGYKGCAAYNDFRELLARKDIDAVVIATPDHWHAFIAPQLQRHLLHRRQRPRSCIRASRGRAPRRSAAAARLR